MHDTPDDVSTWYIPHHEIYHPRKPEKIRVVFDCSARFRDTSLNDHLLTGPDFINALPGVLCRFREHRIALICDVERMFHRFHVSPRDRDFLRSSGGKTEIPKPSQRNIACECISLEYRLLQVAQIMVSDIWPTSLKRSILGQQFSFGEIFMWTMDSSVSTQSKRQNS